MQKICQKSFFDIIFEMEAWGIHQHVRPGLLFSFSFSFRSLSVEFEWSLQLFHARAEVFVGIDVTSRDGSKQNNCWHVSQPLANSSIFQQRWQFLRSLKETLQKLAKVWLVSPMLLHLGNFLLNQTMSKFIDFTTR